MSQYMLKSRAKRIIKAARPVKKARIELARKNAAAILFQFMFWILSAFYIIILEKKNRF